MCFADAVFLSKLVQKFQEKHCLSAYERFRSLHTASVKHLTPRSSRKIASNEKEQTVYRMIAKFMLSKIFI